MEIFCNILHVFTVTFDQFNAALMHKNIILFQIFEWFSVVFNINNNKKYLLSNKAFI